MTIINKVKMTDQMTFDPVELDLLDLPELVAVTQDQVHVFVEGLEGANEDAAVLQDAPHPEVDVLQHLTALTHRLRTNQREG